MVAPIGWSTEITQYQNAYSLETPPSRVLPVALDEALLTATDQGHSLQTLVLVQEDEPYAKAICHEAKTWAAANGITVVPLTSPSVNRVTMTGDAWKQALEITA